MSSENHAYMAMTKTTRKMIDNWIVFAGINQGNFNHFFVKNNQVPNPFLLQMEKLIVFQIPRNSLDIGCIVGYCAQIIRVPL